MGDAGMPKSLTESLENTKVDYVQLGASGLRVSIPILGAMSFGKLLRPTRGLSWCSHARSSKASSQRNGGFGGQIQMRSR
jgi:hypothetical protein